MISLRTRKAGVSIKVIISLWNVFRSFNLYKGSFSVILEFEKIERYFEKLQSFATAHNFKGLDEMIYKYLGEAREQILQPRYDRGPMKVENFV